MKNKVRIGKDFTIRWAVVTSEGEPYAINADAAILRIYSPYGAKDAIGFIVSGNIIEWVFKGKDQKHLGDYTIELVENNGRDGMVSVDFVEAFTLVAHTNEESLNDEGAVEIQTIELTSQIALAPVTTGGGGGGSYDDTKIKQDIAGLKEKDVEIGQELTELSAEMSEISEANGIIPMQKDVTPASGTIAIAPNGKLVEYAVVKDYASKYKVVASASTEKEFTFNHPGYYYQDTIKTDNNSSGYIQHIAVDLTKAIFEDAADADGIRWAKHYRIALYFNESDRITSSSGLQSVAYFDDKKDQIYARYFRLNTTDSDKFRCSLETISAEQALEEAGDSARVYKFVIELATYGDGTPLFGIDASGSIVGTWSDVHYIGYSLAYSTSRMHSIYLMDDYDATEGWNEKSSSANSLMASKDNFGKVRMWLSQDAEGNVLNISTEL